MELSLPGFTRYYPPPSPPRSPYECGSNRSDLIAIPRTIAVVPDEFCAYTDHSDRDTDACYLLSDDALLGSLGAIECIGLERDRNTNLPAFAQWGFLHPGCWSYASVRHFKRPWIAPSLVGGRDEAAANKRLATSASQEWAHPSPGGTGSRSSKPLRVVVRGRCLPFLLANFPHLLSQGLLRRDTLMTTVFESAHTQRRSLVVERVVVNEGTAPALARIRAEHRASLNPVVQQPDEQVTCDFCEEARLCWERIDCVRVEMLTAPIVDTVHTLTATYTCVQLHTPTMKAEYMEARRARSITAWRLIAVNVAVVALNFGIAARGIIIWRFLQRLRVVEWIELAQPHVGVTLKTMRVLDWVTLPVRLPLAPLAWLVRGPFRDRFRRGPRRPPAVQQYQQVGRRQSPPNLAFRRAVSV